MRQGEYLSDKTLHGMMRRRVVWRLLRKYFDELVERFRPGARELVDKVAAEVQLQVDGGGQSAEDGALSSKDPVSARKAPAG
jgi:hypothetical protein